MGELFTAQYFIDLGQTIYQWLLVNVFVRDNAVQLAIVGLAFGAARLVSRQAVPLLRRVSEPKPLVTVIGVVVPLVMPLLWLLLLALTIVLANALDAPNQLLEIATSLLTAWIAIRLVSQLAPSPRWARAITWAVWSVAALNILNLLDRATAILDGPAIVIGEDLRLSPYTVGRTALALVVLLSLASYLTRLLEGRIRASRELSPSVQVLFLKSIKATLVSFAVLLAVVSIGFDLTALAVVGGALGIGAGFGLQRVISNMVSGVVLLLDRSIRPGDVISVSGTYGWVTALAGRYVSVVTRDGVEHLIPNETLISERVENWTHTNSHTRLKVSVPVHYDTDLHVAMALCVQAAKETKRVLEQPECKCLFIGFGDRALDLEIRIWIGDAHNGVQNVKSDVLLRVWELFREHGIKVPYPQRDVHVHAAGGP